MELTPRPGEYSTQNNAGKGNASAYDERSAFGGRRSAFTVRRSAFGRMWATRSHACGVVGLRSRATGVARLQASFVDFAPPSILSSRLFPFARVLWTCDAGRA